MGFGAHGNLFVMAERMARVEAPPSVNDAIRLGRLTALQKPRGDSPKAPVPHNVPTAQQSRGSGNGAFPVCDDHQSRHLCTLISNDGHSTSFFGQQCWVH